MAKVRARVQYAVVIATLFLCLRFIGQFSWAQSGLLSLFASAGFWYFHTMLTGCVYPVRPFAPYRVIVWPKWEPLLIDYKIVKDHDELNKLYERQARFRREPWDRTDDDKELEGHNCEVLPQSIAFTVLRPRPDVDLPGLIYWDSRKVFTTQTDLEELIGGIRIGKPMTHELSRIAGCPSLYIGTSFQAFELGLEVDCDWWEEQFRSGQLGDLTNTKAEADHMLGTTKLTIATVPRSEFDDYFNPSGPALGEESDYYERRKKQHEANEASLSQNGWKREKNNPEVRQVWARIEHKYFWLWHRYV